MVITTLVDEWVYEHSSFHMCTRKRRVRNRVTMVKDMDDVRLESEEKINKASMKYFTNIFN